MNYGPISIGSSTCLGGVFDTQASGQGTDERVWLVGEVFPKNVYSVLRFQPPAVGFVESNVDAGGSWGECLISNCFFYSKRVLPGIPRGGMRTETQMGVETLTMVEAPTLALVMSNLLSPTQVRPILTKVSLFRSQYGPALDAICPPSDCRCLSVCLPVLSHIMSRLL